MMPLEIRLSAFQVARICWGYFMTAALFTRPPRGLRLVFSLNRDRLLYGATITLALWLGAETGRYLFF